MRPLLEREPLEGVVVELVEPERFGDVDDPDDVADLADLVRKLRVRGARIAVTSDGRADVPVIAVLAPDIVRVGRSVIDGIEQDDDRCAMVAEVRELLDARGARLLAHGIESRAELDALVALDVPLGQGYFIGRPAPGWARPAPPRRGP